jgi:hypothetical protein
MEIVTNQSGENRKVGLNLRQTDLVMFGSPAANTPVMAAALAGINALTVALADGR